VTSRGALTCLAVTGVGEVTRGDDLAEIIAARANLVDGDILVVTSKVVSKSEGRVVALDATTAQARETDRVVARRGATAIVRTHHGLVMAAAGVDASNTAPGTVVLLPVDPDSSARELRARLATGSRRNIAVLVTDTSGRAWRIGQTDIAIGAAGIEPMHDYAGRTDDYGNLLEVTAPAVADEIAGAADLVKGKLGRCPAAVVRGLSDLVLPTGEDGPGARALLRDESFDMFGYGARDAVLAAVGGDPSSHRGFGAAASAEHVIDVLSHLAGDAGSATIGADDQVDVLLRSTPRPAPLSEREVGRLEGRLSAAAFAMGWLPVGASAPGTAGLGVRLGFRRRTP